jgi:hypothetical protein
VKTCTKCRKSKPLEAFNTRASRCKPCRAEDKRAPATLARAAERRRERYAQDEKYKQERLDANRKSRYGITPERYAALLEEQDDGCAICHTDTPGGHGAFHVDHDHACCPGLKSCGQCIRGLLCHHCNLLLGNAKDDIKLLMDAVDYLRGA